MPELTKTHRTEVKIKMDGMMLIFSNIPKKKLQPFLLELESYRTEPSIDWRELAKADIKSAGGESAMMLKSARLRHKLTQRALAKMLSTDQANISKMECGEREISKTIAKHLGKIFKTDYRVFL